MSWSAINIVRMAAPLLALGALLAACSDVYYDRRDPIALSFGDALAADKAIQTIDPWPPKSNDRNIAFNGDRMQTAAARYRTGRVIPPASMTTSSYATQQQNQQQQGPPPIPGAP